MNAGQTKSAQSTDDKLVSARTRLILDKPFLGALVLRLPMVEGDPSWCTSTFSNGEILYYNADYIDSLDLEETQFALSHEALHCALSHFYRRGHREKQRWDKACDYAVNPLLIKDGLTPTPDALFQEEYEGMTAEEIYPCLDEEEADTKEQSDPDENEDKQDNGSGRDQNQGKRETETSSPEDDKGDSSDNSDKQQTENTHQQSGAAQEPEPMSAQQLEKLKTQWQQRLAAAAQSAHQRGALTGDMARVVDFLLQPQLPWRMLLARYMSMTARDDYSYSRPSSRRGDPAVYPSLRSSETDVVVVIDTSGSISEEEISDFLSEIDAIKGQVRARITLLTCDCELNKGCPLYFEPWEEFSRGVEIRGGGGTNFSPPFEWVKQQDRDPDLLIYFTDARGIFPKPEPMYPVLWLVKGMSSVPFGERIQLN